MWTLIKRKSDHIKALCTYIHITLHLWFDRDCASWSEWRWSFCDLASRPPVECQWRTSQARGADRKGDRTLWGQEWDDKCMLSSTNNLRPLTLASHPSFVCAFCSPSLAQAQGPVSRPQPSGEANRLSRRGGEERRAAMAMSALRRLTKAQLQSTCRSLHAPGALFSYTRFASNVSLWIFEFRELLLEGPNVVW
jgi:hypothetical protein